MHRSRPLGRAEPWRMQRRPGPELNRPFRHRDPALSSRTARIVLELLRAAKPWKPSPELFHHRRRHVGCPGGSPCSAPEKDVQFYSSNRPRYFNPWPSSRLILIACSPGTRGSPTSAKCIDATTRTCIVTIPGSPDRALKPEMFAMVRVDAQPAVVPLLSATQQGEGKEIVNSCGRGGESIRARRVPVGR